jgi:cell division protease FtsH
LSENKDKLTLLATKLLEKEVIFKEDLEEIFGKRAWAEEELVSTPKHEESIGGSVIVEEAETPHVDFDEEENNETEVSQPKSATGKVEPLNGQVTDEPTEEHKTEE